MEHTVPVLRLSEHQDRLCEFWARAVLPPRLRALIGSMLDAGLPDVPLAYPTDWGITWGDGLRVDVWAEMALANLYAPARHLDPEVHTLADCVRAWRGITEQWLFLGIDNAFYYAVLIPAVHLAAGLPAARRDWWSTSSTASPVRSSPPAVSTPSGHTSSSLPRTRAPSGRSCPWIGRTATSPTSTGGVRGVPGHVRAGARRATARRAGAAGRPGTGAGHGRCGRRWFDSALAVRCALAAAKAVPTGPAPCSRLVAGVD